MTDLLAPLDITGIMIDILKDRFIKSTQFKYDDDLLKTKIKIGMSYDWDATDTNHRPGVYIKRDDIVYNNPRVGMGDMYNINTDGSIDYSAFINTSWSIFCVSKLPGEIDNIVKECVHILLPFMPVIRNYFGFERFTLSRISSINPIEEHKEFYNIVISTMCSYNERWQIISKELPITDFALMIKMYVDKRGNEAGLKI